MKIKSLLSMFIILIAFNCDFKPYEDFQGLNVNIEITVTSYDSLQYDYVGLPGICVEILTLENENIEGERFRKISNSDGKVIFKTFTCYLKPDNSYYMVLSDPDDPSLKNINRKFTIPRIPNRGDDFFIKWNLIFTWIKI